VGELLAGVVVAAAALILILEPIVRRPGRFRVARKAEDADFEAMLAPLEESESPKVQALLALKEIEFDRATGKLSDDDYRQLRASYSAMAMQAIKAEDAADAKADAVAVVAAEAVEDSAEALVARMRKTLAICPQCGPRPETGATFCSNCGRTLTA